MAIDFDLIKRKKDLLAGKKPEPKSTSNWAGLWKPNSKETGEYKIRIVPNKVTPKFPFVELKFYYIAGKTILSPLSFDESADDPIFEYGMALRRTGISKDIYKEFLPKARTFAPIIVRGEEEKGVRWWGFGVTTYKDLIKEMDPDDGFGDITDPESGRDIKLIYTPQSLSPTQFAKSDIMIVKNSSHLSSNPEQRKAWLTDQPDLLSIYTLLNTDELKQLLKEVTLVDKSTEVLKSNVNDSVGGVDEDFDAIFKDN